MSSSHAEHDGTLPPPPSGKSTVIGGVIRTVDPVRDQVILRIFGSHPVKILYDARTRVYRNGVRSSLRDLHPNDHASVETVLDGNDIYAISIHMLSQTPQGQCNGQVLTYDPVNHQLTVSNTLTRAPITLSVPAGTDIVRQAQISAAVSDAGTSALVKGALISATFNSDNQGHGIATRIVVLATPGSDFVFNGTIVYLDLHAGTFAVADPTDGKSYTISFNPSHFTAGQKLRQGERVKVTATFDGSRYTATAIAVE